MAAINLYPIISSFAVFLIVIGITAIVERVSRLLITRFLKRSLQIITAHVQRFVSISIWFLGIIIALEQLGLRLDIVFIIIFILGIAGVIAMRDTLQNTAAKYFSDVYVPYKIGDTIRIREFSGRVIGINPISTVLLEKNGDLVSVPNVLFLREVVVNMSQQAWKEAIIPLTIRKEISIPEFESELLKACYKMRPHLDDRFPPTLTVKRRDENGTDLELTLILNDVNEKEAIIAEINEKAKELVERLKRR